ncbi:hypothetical protein DFH09DRAFT_1105079 [Mycena vulgaris]|nr:hypothetical protein DFH09DRAFT_1105079 [Mycena vulgaris]
MAITEPTKSRAIHARDKKPPKSSKQRAKPGPKAKNNHKRLKAQVPIREMMHTPMGHLVQPLLDHFNQLLEVHEIYHGTVSSSGTAVTNIQNILGQGLNLDNPDLITTIYRICHFNRFRRQIPDADDLVEEALHHFT